MRNIIDLATRHAVPDGFQFVSTLDEAAQRFLARAIAHALARGRRTPGDLLRHFPPSAIMKGLAQNAELRAFILASTTGIKEKIALRKSWEDAAADLRLAFDEGETTAEAIVELFPADACVRHLEAQKLWQFLGEGDFWNVAPSDQAATGIAREHVAYLLDSALEEELLDQRDIVEAITVPELADRLPREHLGALLRCALDNGKNRLSFTAVDLLGTTGPRILVQYVPLPHLWNAVVRPRIARRHGYEGSQEPSARSVAASLAPASPAPPGPMPASPIPASPTAANPAPPNEGVVLHQDDHEEITRVMPGATFLPKPGTGAPAKPGRDVPNKPGASRAGAQRPAREDPFADEATEGHIVMIDDAVKAG